MIVSATTIDLGDGIANGLAAIAVIISVIALFVADSRAKDANEIALDANKTSRDALDIAQAAHQRTVEHYEHIESQDLERIQAEFKELTAPLLSELAQAIITHELDPRQKSNKFVDPESLDDQNNSVYEYTLTVIQKVNARQAKYFLAASQEVSEAQQAYLEAYSAYLADVDQKIKEGGDEISLDIISPTSVDEDHTGRLRVTKENLSRVIMTHYELLFDLSYAEDYRAEMNRNPTILKALHESSQNDESASRADSEPD